MANKRWNKIQKIEADINGLVKRTAWWDEKTETWKFRSKPAMKRYFELQKMYDFHMKKLKNEIEVNENDESE